MNDVLSKEDRSLPDCDELIALSNVYALLGRLWLQEVDALLLSQLQEGSLGSSFLPSSDEELGTESVDDLAADYCRLFVGPREHCPPLQSVWQQGKLDSETTASVRSFADAIGYEASATYPTTFADHLGVELEIMSRAVHAVAIQSQSAPDDRETKAFAGEFFRRHLCWTDRLIDTASEKTHAGFYRTMLVNTRDFLESEKSVWLP